MTTELTLSIEMNHSNFLHLGGAILMLVSLAAGASAAVMALWNNIVTDVCGFAAVSFWQASGLLVLGLILSGGMILMLAAIGHGISHGGHRARHKLYRKWRDMSDEQRRDFLASRGFSLGHKSDGR